MFRDLGVLLEATWAEWADLRLERLLFAQSSTARQAVVVLIGVSIIFIVIRSFGARNPGQHRMALPAIITRAGWSRASLSRHGALVLALAGLPFFILALADPRTALTRSETHVSRPPHQPADRRLVQHAVGAALDQAREGRAQ